MTESFKRHSFLYICLMLLSLSFVFSPPQKALLKFIDVLVLSQLFLLMLSVQYLIKSGVLQSVSTAIAKDQKSVNSLAVHLVIITGFLSMFVTNDIALITLVPMTMQLYMSMNEKILRRIIILVTLAANLGSMLTPFGNPQNLFIYETFHLSLWTFIRTMLPFTLISFGMLVTLAKFLLPNEAFCIKELNVSQGRSIDQFISILCFITAALAILRIFPFWSVLPMVALIIFFRARESFKKVDYELLLIFICFFLLSGQLQQWSLLSTHLYQWVEKSVMLTAVSISQVISNVPAAILLARYTSDAVALLIGTNIGGLGTLIASMASLISYRFYVKGKDAKPIAYITEFTFWNVVFLVVLIFLAYLL